MSVRISYLGLACCARLDRIGACYSEPVAAALAHMGVPNGANMSTTRAARVYLGAPQGLSYGQRQSEQMVNKGLSVAAKYIKFRGFVRLDELEVTGSPLVMFHPRSS